MNIQICIWIYKYAYASSARGESCDMRFHTSDDKRMQCVWICMNTQICISMYMNTQICIWIYKYVYAHTYPRLILWHVVQHLRRQSYAGTPTSKTQCAAAHRRPPRGSPPLSCTHLHFRFLCIFLMYVEKDVEYKYVCEEHYEIQIDMNVSKNMKYELNMYVYKNIKNMRCQNMRCYMTALYRARLTTSVIRVTWLIHMCEAWLV